MNPYITEEEKSHQQIEYQIHCAIVDQLPGAFPIITELFWHTPNRGSGGADGHFKQMMGAKKGASDLAFSWNLGKQGILGFEDKLECGWYEVKAPGRKIESTQNKWLSRFAHIGWHTGWGTSVTHAFNTFELWGIPRKHWGVKEPDLRSDMRKKSDVFEMYKP